LKAKEREKQKAIHIENTKRLVTEEIEMLQVVLHMVMRSKKSSFIVKKEVGPYVNHQLQEETLIHVHFFLC
jgi:hypothetical protein